MKNSDARFTPTDPLKGEGCPKCGLEMESIDTCPGAPSLQQIRLCPNCYLVMWSDQTGLHIRQGVPMGKSVKTPLERTGWSSDPKEC
jgi:hypothetical protein